MSRGKQVRMPLGDLHEYPLQAAFFSDCSAADELALAADLRLRGQLSPVVVMPAGNKAGLPAGTILDGHRRVRLLREAGNTEVLVEVRIDLKHEEAAVVESEFLKYNLLRRQLHPLDKARAVKRLYDLERLSKDRQVNGREVEARDRVGKAIGMSGRNLSRYLALLETPLEVQQAVRDRLLPLVLGSRVANLPLSEQRQIATEIASLREPTAVTAIVARCFDAHGDGDVIHYHKTVGNAVSEFAKFLRRVLPSLDNRVDEITPRMCADHLSTFARTAKLLKQLLKPARQRRAG